MANNKNNVPVKSKGKEINWFTKVKNYITSVYNELKKVHWPGKQQLIAYTGVVLFSVVLVASIIWLFDTGLGFVLELLFKAFA